MANLIITVISIALVGVAAIMGAYYGGDAFLKGQDKSRANTVVSAAGQIAGAWQLLASENGGSYTLTDANWLDGTMTDLVPKYMSSVPYFSFSTHPDFMAYAYRFFPIKLASNNTYEAVSDANVIALLVPENVCKQINYIATGNATVSGTMWGGFYNTATALSDLKPFYCATQTNTSVHYAFMYRIF